MNKKILLVIGLIATPVLATNFVIVVDEKQNNYEVGGFSTEELLTGSWINVGDPENCINPNITESDIYFGQTATQIWQCQQKQSNTKTITKTYDNGTVSTETETVYQFVDTTNSTNITGTLILDSCKEILDNGYSIGDGNYEITSMSNAYCDMTRNGGGWTRLTNYNWYEDQNNYPTNDFNNEIGRVIVDTGNVARNLLDGWWVEDWTTSADVSNQRWKMITATPTHAWTESMVDLEGLGFRSLDGWWIAQQVYPNLDGQYLDGFSLTYQKNNQPQHMHSFAIGHNNDSNIKSNELSWLPNDEFTYNNMYDRDASLNHIMNISGLVTKTKAEGSEVISLRFMANQIVTDETIGFRKYILWIR